MPNDHSENVAETYLALRLGMVLLVGLLFVSAILQIDLASCVLGSISAFYYTAARSVFIAALAAIGALLIVYRGNTDRENVLLDFCGFFAFAVAFVPTPIDKRCPASYNPPPEEVAIAVKNNLLALLFIGFVATFVGRLLLNRTSGLARGTALKTSAKGSFRIFLVALLVGAGIFWFRQDLILRWGHPVAAGGLFVCIVAVVIVNAIGLAQARSAKSPWFRNEYWVVAVVMVITLVALLVAGPVLGKVDRWVLAVEAALIFQFAVFWSLQTAELKGKVKR